MQGGVGKRSEAGGYDYTKGYLQQIPRRFRSRIGCLGPMASAPVLRLRFSATSPFSRKTVRTNCAKRSKADWGVDLAVGTLVVWSHALSKKVAAR